MKHRQPARAGLSYLDANRGRLITEGPDVLGIKDEIHSRWPGVIECYFDTEALVWVLVEKCRDGAERLIFTRQILSSAVIDDLQKIDEAAHRQPDLAVKVEKESDQAEADKEKALSEAIGEPLERLEHALQDVVLPVNKVFFGPTMRNERAERGRTKLRAVS